MILAGDIGGTKTVLALFEPRTEAGESSLHLLRESSFASRDYDGLEGILAEFLGQEAAAGTTGWRAAASRQVPRPARTR